MRGNLKQGRIKIRIPSVSNLLIGILEYLWVIFVVLNGNSVYHSNSIRNLYLMEGILVLTFLLLSANVLCYRSSPSKSSILGAVAIAGYCVVYFCFMQYSMSATNYLELFIIGAPLTFLLFAELYRHGRFLKLFYKFVDIITLLAVVSLVFWFLGEVFKVIKPNGYVDITWGNFSTVKGYYGIHYAFQLDTTFFPNAYLFRNSSIFSEAPMFNLWLDIAMAIEIFLKPKVSKLRVAILVITIFTTLSVTGILFMVLCVILSALLRIRNMNKAQACAFILTAIVVIPVLAWAVITSFNLKVDTRSYEMRLADYVDGFRLWMDYPLFGAGFANLHALHAYNSNIVVGFSNSITAVLGTGGLWMALLYYIPYVGVMVPRASGSKKIACFGVCMMYLFVTTIFFARYIGVVMVLFGYTVIAGKKYLHKNQEVTL